MKRKILILFLSAILLTIYPLKVYCQPTDEEIKTSIEKGIDFLINVEQQNADGSWGGDIYNFTAYTGFVLIKLCDRAYELGMDSPFDEDYLYHQQVINGFNYLFTHVRANNYTWEYCDGGSIPMEGMYIGDGPVGFQPEMYNATIATMALGACNTPDRKIDCPESAADGWTHLQLMQQMVDFYRWAQNHGPTETVPGENWFGGWGNRPTLAPFCCDPYDPSNPDAGCREWGNTYSDNSSSGYVAFALQYAEAMGCSIPPQLKEDLSVWIDYIQNTSEGGSGYFNPNGWLNLLRTGNLLAEMSFVGDDITTPRVQKALSYIETYWDDPTTDANAPGWQNWPMAMYSLMKGFQSFGITTIEKDGSERNWYEEFVENLLPKQAPEGAWYEGFWGDGITNTCWALLILEGKIKNQPPKITEIILPFDPVAVYNQPVDITVNYKDPDDPQGADEYECKFDFGDGSTSTSTCEGLSCSTEHTYDNPGVYSVKVRVTDKGGLFDEKIATNYIVIFDPSNGFVTGGGWINSPKGALIAEPSITGTANFGFVAKYKKGKTVPEGNTEFQFQAGNLNFHSEDFDWLIIAGAKVKFKGVGTINGLGLYGFQVSAIDASLTPSAEIDKFRIKIWEINGDVVYDNMLGVNLDENSPTEIAGGSITIHKSDLNKNNFKSGLIQNEIPALESQIPANYSLCNYPNPFDNSTTIEFSVPVETKVLLKVYNLFGQEVETLVNQQYIPGTYFTVFNGNGKPNGGYVYKMITNDCSITKKMILNK